MRHNCEIFYNDSKIQQGSGFFEIKVESTMGYFNLLEANNNFKGFIFRGQPRSSYSLVPGIARNYDHRKAYEQIKYCESIEQHFNRFKIAIRGHVDLLNITNMDKMNIWALGQHFGLKTPLLDWTASPWVALYFAFREKHIEKNTREDRAVYFLNASLATHQYYWQIKHHFETCFEQNLLNQIPKPDFGFDNSFVELIQNGDSDEWAKIIDVCEGTSIHIDNLSEYFIKCCRYAVHKVDEYFTRIISPSGHLNARLFNQRGLFTYSPTPDSVEKELWFVEMNSKPFKSPLLLKVVFPNEIRIKTLEILYEMNINDMSLFPDIQGASSYCNWKFERAENI